MSDELPKGWATARMRALFDCWGGMTPSTSVDAYWGGTMPWVSSKDVKARFVDGGTECVTAKALTETRLRKCQPGTVLVVVRSGILAHTLPVAIATREVVVNQDVKALDSGNAQLNEWLSLYLRAHEREILEGNRKDGTTVQSIRVEQLLDREMPIAPPAEQRRIVEKVEALLDQVNRAKARLDRVPLILKRFRKAVVAAACSGNLTADWRSATRPRPILPAINDMNHASDLPQEWFVGPLRTVARIHHGFAFSSKRFSEANPGPVVLTPGNFRPDGKLNIESGRVVRHEDGYPADWLLTAGSLVVVMTDLSQKKLLLGVPALISTGAPILHNQRIGRVELTTARVIEEYLWLAMLAPDYKRVIDETATGSLVVHTSPKRLLEGPIPLPPVDEQHEIVRRARHLLRLADATEQRVAKTTTLTAGLTRAILSKAFSGELVPTEAELARAEGRDYETAPHLLGRIRRAEALTAPRRRASGSRSAVLASP